MQCFHGYSYLQDHTLVANVMLYDMEIRIILLNDSIFHVKVCSPPDVYRKKYSVEDSENLIEISSTDHECFRSH